MLSKIYLIVILTSTLIGLYYYKALPQYLKYLSIALVCTLLVELIAFFVIKRNIWFFNIFLVFEFPFYIWLYRQILTSERQKKIIVYFLTIQFIAALLNLFFFQGLFKFNNYSYALGCILICICSLFYYTNLLQSPQPQALKKLPMFWISTGHLIYYSCNFFLTGLLNYIMSINLDLAKQLFAITMGLNIIMYTLFSVGIVCSTSRQK